MEMEQSENERVSPKKKDSVEIIPTKFLLNPFHPSPKGPPPLRQGRSLNSPAIMYLKLSPCLRGTSEAEGVTPSSPNCFTAG